jgi:hypothetical protein
MSVSNLSRSALSSALFASMLIANFATFSPSAQAANKKAKAQQDAERRVAEIAAELPNEIASTFESTLPCELRAPEKKKGEYKFKEIAPKSKIPLFQSREIAEMEIDTDFEKLRFLQKGNGTTPGVVRYSLKNGKQVSLPIEISVRGNSKRNICKDFRPLMLHFKKEDTKGTVFEHIGNHVKLATHCSDKGSHDITEANSQIVVRESAAYQILEDNGFLGYKTRLAKMTYKGPDGQPVADGIGFFLEPDGKMAERWGYKHDKSPEAFEKIPVSGRQNFFLGKLLVGAHDHSDGHNTVAIAKQGQSNTLAFYDLDMSEMANPGYNFSWRNTITIDPRVYITDMKQFIEKYPDGPEAGKAFLERALARKEHTMGIVDKLPIQTKDFIKGRLNVWYGAIENVLHNGPVPAAYTVKKEDEIKAGTYGQW